MAITILLVVGIFLPSQLLVPALGQAGSLSASIIYSVVNLLNLPLPIAFGIAILRYRLYDIDVLINRTLVYGTLSAILALVYFGLIVALQYLLRWIINQHNDVAIVISTFIIATLFQPLRRRVQTIIDRRFYRHKYDAARTLAAFSTTLRNVVDLDQLREQLVTVVQETMQPSSVALWFIKSERGVNYDAWGVHPLSAHAEKKEEQQ